MDIYKFFHPHHNPRLHSTPIRQQELSELENCASELRKALERAKQRTIRKASGPILPEHFTDIVKALGFVEKSLQTLSDAHPGDTARDQQALVEERSSCPGWETWTNLVNEQLQQESRHVTRVNGEDSEPFSGSAYSTQRSRAA